MQLFNLCLYSSKLTCTYLFIVMSREIKCRHSPCFSSFKLPLGFRISSKWAKGGSAYHIERGRWWGCDVHDAPAQWNTNVKLLRFENHHQINWSWQCNCPKRKIINFIKILVKHSATKKKTNKYNKHLIIYGRKCTVN